MATHAAQRASTAAKQADRTGVRAADKTAPRCNALSPHRQIGNRALGQLLAPYQIQPKLIVAPAGDRFEREADRVADAVVRPTGPTGRLGHGITRMFGAPVQRACAKCTQEELRRKEVDGNGPYVQRKCSECEQKEVHRKAAADDHSQYLQRKCSECEDDELHRKATAGGVGLSVSPAVERGIAAARYAGQPISGPVRLYLEPRFGRDLSAIRVHTDTAAASLASTLHAHAFTTGNDIFFATGRYQPHTVEGRRLLAHEVVHTFQQGSGGAPALQRQADVAPVVTEAQAMAEIKAGEDTAVAETPEEIEAGRTQEAPLDERKVVAEAKAAQADPGGGEVEIPDFDVDARECVILWEEEPESEAPQKEEGSAGNESLFKYLVNLATSSGIGGFSIGGLGIGELIAGGLSPLTGVAAAKIWKALPLSIRATVINLAIDTSIAGVRMGALDVVLDVMLGGLGALFRAGMLGFLKRLRKVDDKEKVRLFEKVGGIVLGLNAEAAIGFSFGVLKGFFIDGLLGIVQMILDMVCLVPRALKFFEKFVSFLKDLPDQMQAAFEAIKEAAAAIASAVGGAVNELKEMVLNPKRALELFMLISEAAKSKAQEIGEAIAEALLRFAHLPARKLGERAGRLLGQTVFEIVAAYFTAGGAAGILTLKTAARAAVKWVLELGKKFFDLTRRVLPLLEDLANVVVRAAKYLTRLFKTVCDKINQAIQRIIDLFHSILGLCRKGSVKCKRPSKKPPADKSKCRGRFIPRLGGFTPHDIYCARVTDRKQDFRIKLGPVRRCTFDAKKGFLLVECKTGHGWLNNPTVQAMPWFGLATTALRAQALRCLATAASCGYAYVWYVQNRHAAAYLNVLFKGAPPVLHRP
jgi:hypothetical protein